MLLWQTETKCSSKSCKALDGSLNIEKYKKGSNVLFSRTIILCSHRVPDHKPLGVGRPLSSAHFPAHFRALWPCCSHDAWLLSCAGAPLWLILRCSALSIDSLPQFTISYHPLRMPHSISKITAFLKFFIFETN